MTFPNANSQKDRNSSPVVSKVVDYIKHEIFLGNLKSGDRIPAEGELCELLNVSRTAVREAVKILDSITVLKVRRGDGTYVAHPDDISFTMPWLFKIRLSDITWREVIEFRSHIEFMVLKNVIAHASDTDITNLENLVDAMDEYCLAHPNDYQEIYRLDMKFHAALIRLTRNMFIEAMYEFTYQIIGPLILKNYELLGAVDPKDIVHRSYLKAIRSRDVMMAAYLCSSSRTAWARMALQQGVTYWPFEAQEMAEGMDVPGSDDCAHEPKS